jgi:phosphoribosylanthranilate isomerase
MSCGLTTLAGVDAAVTAGADAVGFVAYVGSPRHLPLEAIARLAADVPVVMVLLTVGLGPAAAMAAVAATGVDGIQPYGPDRDDVAAAALAEGLMVLRPVAAAPGLVLPEGGVPLVDTPDRERPGGTGRVFDWDLVADLETDFVLAGGLGPDNVAEAVSRVRPWGVDASSGLERSPGIKDVGKVTAFVEEAKRA